MATETEPRVSRPPIGRDAPQEPHQKPLVVIEPVHGWVPIRLRELWRYRELVGFLAWRDVSVRYRQTAIGIAWAVVQPFTTMVIFSIVFGRLAGLSSEGLPYPLFAYAALVPWAFFAYCLMQSGTSLLTNQNLITKVYFPRLAIPLAVVAAALVDFLLASTVLGAMMLWYGIGPSGAVVFVPFFLLLAVATALGVGLWLSALSVRYRDVQYVIPFLLQIWLFSTPIAYEPAIFPEPWRTLLGLNPMAGVVEGFRWALLDADTAPGPIIALSVAVATVMLVSGLFYFRRFEAFFADRI